MSRQPDRVAIFGAESTGKTALAERLAAYFDEPWAPEFVRAFWDARDGRITAADLTTIARGQIDNEARAARRARRLVFCDTELLTNVLWADLLFPGHCPAWVRRAARRRSRRYALYLLCDTDLAFADDPQRSFADPEARAACRRLFRQTLIDRDLPFFTVRGQGGEREARATRVVERHVLRQTHWA